MKEATVTKSKGAKRLTPMGKRRITAGSEYRLGKHEDCPFQLWCVEGEKLSEPENHYMANGKRVHDLAEQYVLGSLKRMPEELAAKFKPDFMELRKEAKAKRVEIQTELQLALDKNMEPTEWFGDNTLYRGTVDLLKIAMKRAHWVANVVDYKYAKFWGQASRKYTRQVRNYAVFGFSHYPQLEEVTGEIWFLKSGDVSRVTYERDDFPQLKETMQEEYAPLFDDRRFEPKPSERECKRCHFRKSNGGPCKEG